MTKAILQILLLAFLSWCGIRLLGWYGFVPVLVVGAWVMNKTTGKSAIMGAVALLSLFAAALLWAGSNNAWSLTYKMAAVFNLTSTPIFVVVHLLVAALLGALSAALGAAFRHLFKRTS